MVGYRAIARGRVLYHDVGCLTCHGPLERRAALGRGEDVELLLNYDGIDGISAKSRRYFTCTESGCSSMPA